MNNFHKVAVIFTIAAIVLVSPVFAQSSPTSISTSGVFTTDVEDSMDVLWYDSVEFDKFASFIGWVSTARPLSLGYATNFGELYLGTWYNGNFLVKNTTLTETVVKSYDLTNQIMNQVTTTTTFNNDYITSNNNLELLFGIAGMGIKVGYDENMTRYKNPNRTAGTSITITEDTINGTTQYQNVIDEYSQTSGSMIPSIAWGMSFNAGDLVIQPLFSASLTFNRDNLIMNTRPTYTENNSGLIGNHVTNITGRNSNNLSSSITIGSNIILPADEENKSKTTIGLNYNLYFASLNNNYNESGFEGDVKGTVSWAGSKTVATTETTTTTTDTTTLTLTEQSLSYHEFSPSIRYEKQISEDLKIGLMARLPFYFMKNANEPFTKTLTDVALRYNNSSDSYLNTTTKTEVSGTTGPLYEASTFNISTSLMAGAIYDLVPGRFSINAGVRVNPFTFQRQIIRETRESTLQTTIATVFDSNNREISNTVTLSGAADTVRDFVSANSTWSALTVNAACGFTMNLGENMTVDMAANSGASNPNFLLNLTTVRVLFTLKK